MGTSANIILHMPSVIMLNKNLNQYLINKLQNLVKLTQGSFSFPEDKQVAGVPFSCSWNSPTLQSPHATITNGQHVRNVDYYRIRLYTIQLY